MVQWLIRKFRNLQMKTQIILMISLITILALVLVGVTFFVQDQIITNKLLQSSSEISRTQDRQNIANIAAVLSQTINDKFSAVINQISKLSQFQRVYDQYKSRIQVNKLQESCVPEEQFNFNSTFLQMERFCYQAQGVSDFVTLPKTDKNLINFNNYISLLDQYSLVLNDQFSWITELVSISETKYYSQFPFNLLIPDLQITNAPWYLYHLNQTEQELVVQPLRQYNNTELKELDISYTIKNNNTVKGYIRSSLLVDEFLIPLIPYNVMLLDMKGNIVYGVFEGQLSSSQPINIFNQDITGFNQSDWQSMLEFADNPNSDTTLQLINKLSNQLIHLYAIHIMHNNFTLIVYQQFIILDIQISLQQQK